LNHFGCVQGEWRHAVLFKCGRGKTLYYAGAMEKEIVSGASTVKTYLPSGLGVIIDNGASAVTRYFHKDHLGSVTAITREDGSLAEPMSYDPFGKRRNIDGSDDPGNSLSGATDNKGYTGHETLDNIGLIHMNGRVYDPTVARFTSADPIVSRPGDGQSFNRYSYVTNNPLKYTDPTGYAQYRPVSDSPRAFNWVGQSCFACAGDWSVFFGANVSYQGSWVVITFADPSIVNPQSPAPTENQQAPGNQGGNGDASPGQPIQLADLGTAWAQYLLEDKQTDSDSDSNGKPVPRVEVTSKLEPWIDWLGLGLTAAELGAGTRTFGTNWNLYPRPMGNQYFRSLIGLGNAFKGFGVFTLAFSIGSEFDDASEGRSSFKKLGVDLAIGAAGVATPILAVPGSVYSLSSYYYNYYNPAGQPDYNATYLRLLNAAEGGGG
jgi:RHS repeat-associated protein